MKERPILFSGHKELLDRQQEIKIVKERPILFSGPMVQAVLDKSKWKTRRVVKGKALEHLSGSGSTPEIFHNSQLCPYGLPGDRLWVRETWTQFGDIISYKADEPVSGFKYDVKWRPSIHMPRTACRILLEITDVRIERLHDISDSDVAAEGINLKPVPGHPIIPPVYLWKRLWQHINGPESWDSNPWVWVISFEKIN